MWCEGLLYSYNIQDGVVLVEEWMFIRVENPETIPHKYVQQIFDKYVKAI